MIKSCGAVTEERLVGKEREREKRREKREEKKTSRS